MIQAAMEMENLSVWNLKRQDASVALPRRWMLSEGNGLALMKTKGMNDFGVKGRNINIKKATKPDLIFLISALWP